MDVGYAQQDSLVEHTSDAEASGTPAAITVRSGRRIGMALAFFGIALGSICIASTQVNLKKKGVSVSMSFSESLQEKFSTGTSYCYEKDSFGDCWEDKPTDAETCTPKSGTSTCLCPGDTGFSCDFDGLDNDPPTTGRCAHRLVYVHDGEKHEKDGDSDITGSDQDVYCKNMTLNDQWKAKGLVADSPPENDNSWLLCWYPNTWYDGKCQRGDRYLGESCWNGWFGAGACAGSSSSYGEYSTSCYQSKCVPYAFAREREECQCAWIGWNVIFACTAKNDVCGGHACVLSAGNGKKYCDYATGQNW